MEKITLQRVGINYNGYTAYGKATRMRKETITWICRCPQKAIQRCYTVHAQLTTWTAKLVLN